MIGFSVLLELDIFTLGSSDSAPDTKVSVKDELVNNLQIRVVRGEILIKFGGNLSELGELIPWDHREIVMFNVVAKVKVGNVEKSKVIIGVLISNKFIMFSNNMSGDRVQSHTQ